MCGIWAIFGSDQDVSQHLHCACAIAHRGPDAFRIETIHDLPNCCLAFHHLAIMNEAHGMQPIRVRAIPDVLMIYNGEIYNYKKIQEEYGFEYETKSDGEAIVHLYHKFGIRHAAAMLDGVFACCLLDLKARKVYIVRDTYGVKPVFRLYRQDGFLAVCSEVKGLIGLVQRNGVCDQIEPCVPGYFEEYDITQSGKVTPVTRRQFHSMEMLPKWRCLSNHYHPSEDNDVYTNIRLLLVEAVRKRLMAGLRVGCMLSGGLDSSLTTALVVKLSHEAGIRYPIQTFSIGMSGSQDLIAARKVAKHLGTEHHEIIVSPQDGIQVTNDVIKCLETYDGAVIRGSIATYLLARYIKQNTDSVVMITGQGSDEVAQGYEYFHRAPNLEEADVESRRILKDISHFDVLRGDRNISAHGLELRVPFLDHYFASYYLSLSSDIRATQNGVEKYLIRKAFDDMDLIPKDILWRSKLAMGDGLGSSKESWQDNLTDLIQSKVTDDMMKKAASRFPINTPATKEAYYYRQIFETHYPGQNKLIPWLWTDEKWTNNNN